MPLWFCRDRHCLVPHLEQGKAKSEKEIKHLCTGLTSWKRIKPSCTLTQVLKKSSPQQGCVWQDSDRRKGPATAQGQSSPEGGSAEGHFTRHLPQHCHPCQQEAPSHFQVKNSRHEEPTVHFDSHHLKGLVLEQAAILPEQIQSYPPCYNADLLLSQKVHRDRVTSAVPKDHWLFLLCPFCSPFPGI